VEDLFDLMRQQRKGKILPQTETPDTLLNDLCLTPHGIQIHPILLPVPGFPGFYSLPVVFGNGGAALDIIFKIIRVNHSTRGGQYNGKYKNQKIMFIHRFFSLFSVR
jgi:hypothetical protein